MLLRDVFVSFIVSLVLFGVVLTRSSRRSAGNTGSPRPWAIAIAGDRRDLRRGRQRRRAPARRASPTRSLARELPHPVLPRDIAFAEIDPRCSAFVFAFIATAGVDLLLRRRRSRSCAWRSGRADTDRSPGPRPGRARPRRAATRSLVAALRRHPAEAELGATRILRCRRADRVAEGARLLSE